VVLYTRKIIPVKSLEFGLCRSMHVRSTGKQIEIAQSKLFIYQLYSQLYSSSSCDSINQSRVTGSIDPILYCDLCKMDGLKELPQGMPVPAAGPQGGEDDAKKAQEEQMRRDVMASVLDTGARERCTLSTHLLNPCAYTNLVSSNLL
jgi:hypothetical protein